MKERTKKFALDVLKFVRGLPSDPIINPMKPQAIRAATGVAFNYRSACRGRSQAEFTARLGGVLDEADESEGWLDVLHKSELARSREWDRLRQEAKEPAFPLVPF